jgi:anti-anti-sigma factor
VVAREYKDELLHVKVYKLSEMSVIAAAGELDISNISALVSVVDGLFVRNLPLLIDFNELKYIDSMGVNTLVHIHERCTSKRIPFSVVANQVVRRILGVMSLQDLFSVFDNTTLAREYFAAAQRGQEPLAGGSTGDDGK